MNLLKTTCDRIAPQDQDARARATEYIMSLTMPRWAMGRLLDLAVDLAGITGSLDLPVARKEVVLMAGDHGIVAQGVCPQPSEVTRQMVYNFIAGGAGINAIAGVAGAHVTVVDMGIASDLDDLVESKNILNRKIAYGTKDFSLGPAMTREQATRSVEAGIQVALDLSERVDVFATGEMGIGNTSPSTAIVTVLAGMRDPLPFVGCGAGLPENRLVHKANMIRRGIELNSPDPGDGLDLLAKVGGFEIGGIAGLILGAAACRKPVLVDGFISSAGALIASVIAPASKEFMFLAHGSAEPGHQKMAQLLGKKPFLQLDMRLGEGSGAAMAMPLLDAASAIMNQMATFHSAGVSKKGIREI